MAAADLFDPSGSKTCFGLEVRIARTTAIIVDDHHHTMGTEIDRYGCGGGLAMATGVG